MNNTDIGVGDRVRTQEGHEGVVKEIRDLTRPDSATWRVMAHVEITKLGLGEGDLEVGELLEVSLFDLSRIF